MSNWITCHTCQMLHCCASGSDEAQEFAARHQGHSMGMITPPPLYLRLAQQFAVNLFYLVEKKAKQYWSGDVPDYLSERTLAFEQIGVAGYSGNANVKEAFGTETALDLTSFNSLAYSLTAGWQSAYIDNSANLYPDIHILAKIAAVNTAPALSKAIFWYAYGSMNTTDFPTTPAASGNITGLSASVGGALTFLDVTANATNIRQYGLTPYLTQNVAIVTPPHTIAQALGNLIPNYWGIAAINAMGTGVTIPASGNSVKYTGVYNTVT